MPEQQPRIHRLRRNARERSPHRIAVLDSEARIVSEGTIELQTLRLWAVRLIRRHGHQPRRPRFEDAWGLEPEPLAEWIEAQAQAKDTLWLYAHNLSYDLTLTGALLLLLRRGWQLGRHNLASDAPWAVLRRGRTVIRFADSWSWLPVPVETLGQLLGIEKLELPPGDGNQDAWLQRCRQDVVITAAAIEGLMDEWDRGRLGWWSLTGPATAWNSMLHKAPAQRAVINPDPAARAFERGSVYAGRRDLWRTGSPPQGPYAYLDFRSAHLAVAAHFRLPDRRGLGFESIEAQDWRLTYPVRSVVARAVVRAETPRYPLRLKAGILHPVGTFETTLCGPELAEARDRGELLQVGPGYSYRLGDQMQPWARWALPLVQGQAAEIDLLLQTFLKMASRTVPGRWGMLVSRETLRGPSHVQGWSLEPAVVGSPPRRGAIFHCGGEWTELVRDQEADDSFPAVLAHVQSWVRLLLQRALDQLLPGEVLQCNTDSLLVPVTALRRLAASRWHRLGQPRDFGDDLQEGTAELSRHSAPLELRVKGVAQAVELLSPQHLRLDGRRLYSGVPASAQEVRPNVFSFWTWPKLAGQLSRGDPRGYVREWRTVSLCAVPVSRWAYQDGCCEPVRASWTPAGGTSLLPPPPGGCEAHSSLLRPLQHPALRGLR